MRELLAFLWLAIVCGGCGSIASGTYPGPGWPKTAVPQPIQKIDPALFCRPTARLPAKPPSEHTPTEPKRDPVSIQKTVRAAFSEFRDCYEAALGRKRDASGRVQVRFAIDASGDVANACIEPPALQDGVAVQCILERFEKLQFGSGGRVTVVYPIMFSPEPEPRNNEANR